jgi:hypothetical protein
MSFPIVFASSAFVPVDTMSVYQHVLPGVQADAARVCSEAVSAAQPAAYARDRCEK